MKKKTPKKNRMDMSQRALAIVKEATGVDSLVCKQSPKKKPAPKKPIK